MLQSGNKRQRSNNFSITETECLVEEVLKRASVIENKKTDAVTWKEKENAWADLAAAFNAQTATNRTVKMLKSKYDTIKRSIKIKHNQGKAEQFNTGGGAAKIVRYTPWEEKLLRLISLSVEGLISQNDSDDKVDVEHAEKMDISEVMWCNEEDDTSSEVAEEIHIIPVENVNEEINNEKVIWNAWTPAILKAPRNKKLKISTKKSDGRQEYSSVISSRADLIDIQRQVAEQELARLAENKEFLRKEDERKETEHQLRVKFSKAQHEAKMEKKEFLRKEDARKEQEHQLRIKFNTAEHEAKMEFLKLQKDQILIKFR